MVLAGAFVAAVAIHFSPEVFGKYSLVFSVIQIGCAAILSWPNQALLRFGRETFRSKGYLGEPLGARLVIHAALSSILIALMLIFLGPLAAHMDVSRNDFFWLFLAAIVVLPASEIGLLAAQACGRFRAYGMAPVLQRAVQLGAVFFVMVGLPPTWQLLLGFSILGYLASALLSWRDVPSEALRPVISISEISRALRYAWALPLATLGAFLLQWMDLWFIRAYMDVASVGHYAWAYTLTMLATSILVPMAAVIAPKAIDHEVDKNLDESRSLMNSIFSVCMLFGALLPIMVVGIALTGQVLVPTSYLMSLPVVLTLSAAMLSQMAMAFAEPLVYAREKLVSKMALIVGVMVCVKAATNVLLIEHLGMMGSAASTVMCYGIGMLLQWRLLGRHMGSGFPSAWPVMVASLVCMAFAASWRDSLLWFAVSGFGLSITFIVVFRHANWFQALPIAIEKAVGCSVYRWLVKA